MRINRLELQLSGELIGNVFLFWHRQSWKWKCPVLPGAEVMGELTKTSVTLVVQWAELVFQPHICCLLCWLKPGRGPVSGASCAEHLSSGTEHLYGTSVLTEHFEQCCGSGWQMETERAFTCLQTRPPTCVISAGNTVKPVSKPNLNHFFISGWKLP